jgi:hypothetical protein
MSGASGIQIPKATKKGSTPKQADSSNRRDSTPSTGLNVKRLRGTKSESSADNSPETPLVDVTSVQDLSGLFLQHRELEKERCPCNQSIKAAWKLDCVKYGQWWHVDCVRLKGISQKGISLLTDYLCPLCFVSPIPTLPSSLATDVCRVCKNTLALQQSNLDMEAKMAFEKIGNMTKCCNILTNIDFKQLGKNIETLGQFDAHLKHIMPAFCK